MSTEKYLGEAAMKDSPKKVINVRLREASVTTEKIADKNITTAKIAEEAVTNDKVAKDSLTIDKFDLEFRSLIKAAVGLPEDLIEVIQDVDKSLDKLNDTVYPITLSFSLSPNTRSMKTDINYFITSDDVAFVPDTLSITKKINDEEVQSLVSTPASSGSTSTPIEGGMETFIFTVTKQGRTSKSISQTRYLCYYGGNSKQDISETVIKGLDKVVVTDVSFNPTITTEDNEYLWLVVPEYLSINRVTSAGIDVTLADVQTITTNFGTFKAYRTANTLTSNTWNLRIY